MVIDKNLGWSLFLPRAVLLSFCFMLPAIAASQAFVWQQNLLRPGPRDPHAGTQQYSGRNIIETRDSGFLILTSLDYWGRSGVIKADGLGSKTWERVFGHMEDGGLGKTDTVVQLLLAAENPSDSFLVIGRATTGGLGADAFFLYTIAMNAAGLCGLPNYIDKHDTSSLFLENSGAMLIDSGNSIIEAGNPNVYGRTSGIRVQKATFAGAKQWSNQWHKSLGDSAGYVAYSVVKLEDGDFMVFGQMENIGYWRRLMLFRTDSFGRMKWLKAIPGIAENTRRASVMKLTRDGNLLLLSYYIHRDTITQPFVGRTILTKVDTAGNVVWEREYAGKHNAVAGFDLDEGRDGGLVVGGYAAKDVNDERTFDFYLLRTDSIGNERWSKEWGTDSSDGIECVRQTHDGNFVVAGWTDSVPSLFLAKVQDLPAAVSENIAPKHQLFNVRYFPEERTVGIELPTEFATTAVIVISDMMGREVLSRSIEAPTPGTSLSLPVEKLATGQYFLTVRRAGQSLTAPVTIVR